MLPAYLCRTGPVLVGPRVRLEPLIEVVLDEYLRELADPEVRRLTGSHSTFTPSQAERWLRPDEHHTDTTGTLVGCLQLPQGKPAPVDHLSAAEAKPCTPGTPEPVHPRIYTPH